MSDMPHLREGKTRDSLRYKRRMWASKEVPDLRCWCPGNWESLLALLYEGKSAKPGLSPAVTHIPLDVGTWSSGGCWEKPGPLQALLRWLELGVWLAKMPSAPSVLVAWSGWGRVTSRGSVEHLF